MVQLVTDAAGQVCGQDARDGYILAKLEHREELPVYKTKSHMLATFPKHPWLQQEWRKLKYTCLPSWPYMIYSLFLEGEVSSERSSLLEIWKTWETKMWIAKKFHILYPIQGGTMWKLTSWAFQKCGRLGSVLGQKWPFWAPQGYLKGPRVY